MAASRKATHKIMLHGLVGAELSNWHTLPYFDAVIVNLLTDYSRDVNALQAMVSAGRQYFGYYDSMDYAHSVADFGGTTPPFIATWFNWLRDNVQFSSGASFKRMRVGSQVGLLFAAGYAVGGHRREYIPWKDIDATLSDSIADFMVNRAKAPGGVTIPLSGLWIDQVWPSHADWMHPVTAHTSGFSDTQVSGAPFFAQLPWASVESNFGTPGVTWANHQIGVETFLTKLDAKLAALGTGAYALANGEHNVVNSKEIRMPWYFENAWDNPNDGGGAGGGAAWTLAQTKWPLDKRNVVSALISGNGYTNAHSGVHAILQFWKERGGWIAFSYNPSDVGARQNWEMAYRDAAMIQAGLA